MEQLKNTVSFIRTWAPWANLIVPVGIILTLGYFHFLYMDTILSKNLGYTGAILVGGILWALIAGARIAALFATVSDFSTGDKWGGSIGLLVSIALLFFDLWFIGKIAVTYGTSGDILSVFLRFCSVLATAMEGRLVLLILEPGMNYSNIGRKVQVPGISQPQSQSQPQSNGVPAGVQRNPVSGNGVSGAHRF